MSNPPFCGFTNYKSNQATWKKKLTNPKFLVNFLPHHLAQVVMHIILELTDC